MILIYSLGTCSNKSPLELDCCRGIIALPAFYVVLCAIIKSSRDATLMNAMSWAMQCSDTYVALRTNGGGMQEHYLGMC